MFTFNIFQEKTLGELAPYLNMPVAGFHRALIPPPLWMHYLIVNDNRVMIAYYRKLSSGCIYNIHVSLI